MDGPNGRDGALRTTSEVLIWCFAFSMGMLLVWFGFVALAGDWVYSVHSCFFDISREHFALTHYLGMAFWKVGAFMLFLFPALAVRLVLRKRGR